MTRDTPSTRGQAEQGPKGQAEHMQELLNFCLKTIGRLDSKSQKIEWSGQDFQDLSKIFQGIDVAIANVHSKSNLHTMTYKFGRGSTQRVMSPSSESKLGPEAKKGGLSDTPSKGSVMSESQKQELYLKALNVYALVWDFMKQMQSATIKGNIVTTLLKVRNNQTEGNSFLDLKFYKDVPDIIRLSKTRRFSTLDVMPGGRIKRMFSPGFSSSADSARAKQTFIQDMNQELGIWENELEATKVKEFMAKTHKTAFPTFHLGHSEQEFARLLLIQKTTIANSLESYIQDKSLTSPAEISIDIMLHSINECCSTCCSVLALTQKRLQEELTKLLAEHNLTIVVNLVPSFNQEYFLNEATYEKVEGFDKDFYEYVDDELSYSPFMAVLARLALTLDDDIPDITTLSDPSFRAGAMLDKFRAYLNSNIDNLFEIIIDRPDILLNLPDNCKTSGDLLDFFTILISAHYSFNLTIAEKKAHIHPLENLSFADILLDAAWMYNNEEDFYTMVNEGANFHKKARKITIEQLKEASIHDEAILRAVIENSNIYNSGFEVKQALESQPLRQTPDRKAGGTRASVQTTPNSKVTDQADETVIAERMRSTSLVDPMLEHKENEAQGKENAEPLLPLPPPLNRTSLSKQSWDSVCGDDSPETSGGEKDSKHQDRMAEDKFKTPTKTPTGR